jgi:hypothetical protein
VTAAAGDAVPSAEQQRAFEEALDRLLEPLADEPPKPNGAVPDLLPIGYAERRTIRDLADRLRWSERGVFPALRRTVLWAFGVVAFLGVVWVILAVGVVR